MFGTVQSLGGFCILERMTTIRITPVFIPAMTSEKRYKRLQGGGGSGKSIGVAKIILARTLMQKGSRAYCFRKVGRTVRDSIFATFVDLINEHEIGHLFQASRSTFSIYCHVTGSEINCRGLDEAEKIKSIKDPTIIWMEEATEFIEDDFMQLDLRLRKPGAKLEFYLTYNPISKENWVYQTFEASDNYRTSEYYLKTTYKDNPYLPAQYSEMLRRLERKSENHYKVYALGDWGEITKGLIFPDFEIVEDLPEVKSVIGLDFGFNDPLAAARVYFADPDIYLDELYFETGKTIPELIQAFNRIGIDRKDLIYYDSARPGDAMQIQRAGYKVKGAIKGANSIIDGISKMKGYNLKVTARSKNLIDELNKYRWDEDKSGQLIDGKPIDAFNHLVDAIRYAIYTHTYKPKTQTRTTGSGYTIKRPYRR